MINIYREDVMELIAALAPFAKVAEFTRAGEYTPYTPELDDDDYISVYHHDIRVKDFRRAKAILDKLAK